MLFWSRSAEALFSYAPDEIVGHDVRELFDEWPVRSPSVRAKRRDGSVFLAEVTCERVDGIAVVTVRDIWGDEALETIEELEHVGTYERDLITGDGRWSDQVYELFGLPRGSRRLTVDEMRLRIIEEDRAPFTTALEESIRKRAPLHVRYRIRRGSETRTLVATANVLGDESGRATRIYGSVRDVTDDATRADLARQLDEMRRVATLGRVAATMAHEFNNVLMGVLTFVEVLKRRREPATIDHAIHGIESGIKRGRTITDEILRYARAAEPVLATIDVASWLADFDGEAQAITSGAAHVHSEEGLFIRGDVSQLNQVLVNLLLNARDASPPQSPIEIHSVRENGALDLVVADQGSGIRPDLIDRIFDPLFTTKQRGTGLGLAVVKQVIEAHRGSIDVKTVVGEGTEFHLRLPLSDAPSQPHAAAGRSLLLVEVDPAVAAGLEALLASEEIEVRVASTGTAAIREIDRARPDVVVLDLHLPDIAGASVYDEVAKRWPGLPVIFVSGSFDPQEVARHLMQPHAAFLYKPFEIEQLLNAIARVAG